MNTRWFFLYVLCAFLSGTSYAGQFTVNAFEDAHFNTPNPVQEVTIALPDDGRLYSTVEVLLTLETPTGLDGDEWDRMGHIYMYDKQGNWVEIARLITPFWNPTWTWTLDITEIQLLLRGQTRIGVWLQSWKDDGYQVSVSFRFTEGTPTMVPVKITNLWNGAAWGYGNPGNTRMEEFLDPISVRLADQVDQVLARVTVTGHRFVDNSQNAAEFLRNNRTLIANGGGNWVNELWQECGNWPVQPQSPGTWQFDRSGWCPGDLVDPWITDITAQITPGQDVVVEYLPDEYINTGMAKDAMEQFGSQLVEMRATNGSVAIPASPWHINAYKGDGLAGKTNVYRFHNFTSSNRNTTFSTNVPWLSVAPSQLTILPGEFATATITLTSQAEGLPPGQHQGQVMLNDLTGGTNEVRTVELTVNEKGLIAHWRFDETQGTIAIDNSGNGYQGNLQGGLDFATASVHGMVGNALELDGSDDLVMAGQVPIEGPFSLSAWIFPHAIENKSGIAYKWHPKGRTFWFGPHDQDGLLRFGVNPSLFEHGLDTPTPVIANNQWYHVTATYDGREQKIFVNGVLVATAGDRFGFLPNKPGDFIIGRVESNNYFDGFLDEMRLHNYALTQRDIQRLYCPADMDGDGSINAPDVPLAYGTWPSSEIFPDLNNDDRKNIQDILVLMGSFGSCP